MQNIAGSRGPVPHTILIVEDHDRLRAGLYDWLSASSVGSRCLTVRSGEQALELAAEQPPEVALIDIRLPYIDGIETTRRIKAIAPGTCIVIISIYEEDGYRVAAASAGASAYICKQRIHTELVPILRELLD
jgi:NarL family two-component system response regulator LiaR